jgi:RimJ/RimL family protein N-acetyltransferase
VPILDTVITARLVLRPFRGTDLDDLHAIQSRADVVRYLPWGVRSVEHEPGEIGVVFHPDARGRGYATEAAAPVLDLAFTKLLLHRVTAGPMRATRHQPR